MSHPFHGIAGVQDAIRAFREAHPKWARLMPLLTLDGFAGCSAIGASLSLSPLPMLHAAYSEIAERPLMVLKQRLPHALSLGDISAIGEETLDFLRSMRIKLAAGGSPCQAFSVAGSQSGLSDPRGQLTPLWARLQDRLEIPLTVWENVPGVFCEDSDGFGHLLGLLVGFLRPDCDWDVLKEDARFAGMLDREPAVGAWMEANPGAADLLCDDHFFRTRRGYTASRLQTLLTEAAKAGMLSRAAILALEAGDRSALLDALAAAPAGSALAMLEALIPFGPAAHELEPVYEGSDLPDHRPWPTVGVVVGPSRTIAWRVLDPQPYDPQRRRRVFLSAATHDSDIDPSRALFDF